MKKLFLIGAVVLTLASCSKTVTTQTARTESVPYAMYNATVADLEVSSQRITYTYEPSKEVRRGGVGNCKEAALMEALLKNGNADLLVEPQYVVTKKRCLFGSKVLSITVSGRPAKYKNFRSLPDGVWTNEVFRDKSKQK
jgi:hypothetical protein